MTNHTANSKSSTRLAIGNLERSKRSLLNAFGDQSNPEQLQVRVHLLGSVSNLLSRMAELWAAEESDAAMNQRIGELQLEVDECMQELQRGRPR